MTDLTTQIEGDLIALLDDWFSLPEVWDNELDRQIHEWYANAPTVYPKRPYFSPSSLGSCPRELYVKAKGAPRDDFRKPPHQSRWAKLGTLGGELIQREMLAIERNYEKLTGNVPRFRFVRNPDGTPMFEDFAKKNVLVEMDGEKFYLYGAPDGIMEYITDDGEKIRVGLEVKSKQTTPAQTSLYSMKKPDSSHARQIVAYAHMFGCEYYVILYVNYAKKAWFMTEEEYEKNPDLRAFCARVTDDHKRIVFRKAVEVTRAVRENKPPKLDLDAWTFNNYKRACALDLSEEELNELRREVYMARHSSLPEWKVGQYVAALKQIEEFRKEAE